MRDLEAAIAARLPKELSLNESRYLLMHMKSLIRKWGSPIYPADLLVIRYFATLPHPPVRLVATPRAATQEIVGQNEALVLSQDFLKEFSPPFYLTSGYPNSDMELIDSIDTIYSVYFSSTDSPKSLPQKIHLTTNEQTELRKLVERGGTWPTPRQGRASIADSDESDVSEALKHLEALEDAGLSEEEGEDAHLWESTESEELVDSSELALGINALTSSINWALDQLGPPPHPLERTGCGPNPFVPTGRES